MSVRDIGKQRLVNQCLQGKPLTAAAEVVSHMVAVQAQDYRGGIWGVGLRMKHATEATVEAAILDRSIVRTWPLRGTLHLVAAEDARWMLDLLAPRVIARAAGRHRQLELSPDTFARSRKLVERKLRGGVILTRGQVYEELEAAGISPAGQRGIHIIQWLAQSGVLCFGPRAGRQHTLVLLDDWLPAQRQRTREEGLAMLALRYFTSHGPATVRDFAWWAGLTLADAGAAARDAESSALEREDAGGEIFWGPRHGPAGVPLRHAALLLPPFDELLVAYKERSAAVDPSHASRLHALLSPTVCLGARIAGTWGRREAKGRVIIAPKLFTPPGRADVLALRRAATRYGGFVGMEAELDMPGRSGAPTARRSRS